jgi:hypothetical protein
MKINQGVLGALMVVLMATCTLAYDVTYATGGVSSSAAGLYVVAVNYDPSPVSPGDYVNVWLKIENRGNDNANDVSVTVPDEYPWTVVGERSVSFGTVGAGQAALASFKLRVDGSAPSGATPLRVQLKQAGIASADIAEIQLNVQRLDAVLGIESVTATPETVAPGDKVVIDVAVKNRADTLLRGIRGNLRLLTQVTTASGLSTLELPFTPLDGGVERTLDTLAPGQTGHLVFTLVADPDAKGKPYKIPLSIVYYDPNGANRTREEVVGIVVGAEPELTVYVDSTELASDTKTGSVIVRFVNHGLSDIKFLTARLNPSDEYVIVSSPEAYIGKIDSDDFETAEFKLALTSKAGNEIQLPLVMEYRDANNRKYSNGVSLTVVRYTPEQLGKQKSATATIVVVIIVLGVVGWFVYRRFRRKRSR